MIIENLIKYMEYKGLNDNQVTTDCRLSVGLINKARRGKSDLGRNTVEKILKSYPDLNRDWLITGKGEMLKTCEENDQPNDQDEYIEPNLKLNDMTLHKLLDAIAKRDRQIECRDQQMNEMLAQQSRLISVIETLSQGTLKQSNVG